MNKSTLTLLGLAFIVVVALTARLLWPAPPPSLCADQVRSYQEAVGSSLSASAQQLTQASLRLQGSNAKTYIDKLTKIDPSDLVAIKACDTQCSLLDRCLRQHPKEDATKACPTEYADYKNRVTEVLAMMAALQNYENATKHAIDQAAAVSTTEKQLAEAQNGVGASGGRQAVLEQRLASQQQQLQAHVAAANAIVDKVVKISAALGAE